MRLIAHRGFASTAPENTISAIRSATDRADAVEFDVRRCGSGELVVIHDETIDRITDGAGHVADTTLAELERYTVLESDERIPTLPELLEAVPRAAEVNLELKTLGIAVDVLAALEAADLENRVVTTSFLESELRAIRELDPDQPTGLLVSRHTKRPVTTAVELDCDVIGANYWRCLSTRLVPRAKRVGLEVHAWSIERRLTATLLEYRGVDCVSADRPLQV
ncbi:glycerophosphodiester phosphodiesterase [Natronobacterium gregoryi]|uniref:Glycerophosphodiester phosphodiesterase n=2 Tax=Natronobacterium gregoryi TaxID=44930 RepID=L0ALA2_NATGS|nr:glycerophosphodiester phosphodiesterase [Natronobacterium gregoryi]AFZ73972.1 glycerophosphoryl diester phosphodiesterase [Natronobacterium gregoryi SP2]ELY68815.1 glycerophosphoryl diester phosphodiesterase [Natronobacterium gregoryi SP2]PLK18281.1 glycerophosphodiester phosphodiesterase [Natronobacterium gregoryi SP2]SFJ72520.1 glycerophosphoryl diester phosphodiesterase [Natronobacterium gregoryi]